MQLYEIIKEMQAIVVMDIHQASHTMRELQK
jgi:hypothetical protein